MVLAGRGAYQVSGAGARRHGAALPAGQDFCERVLRAGGPAPWFGPGKSCPGFTPPAPGGRPRDEFDAPDGLELTCAGNGEKVRHGRTRQMIFPVPVLIAELCAVLPLLPGGVARTGTPAGAGPGRTPHRRPSAGAEPASSIHQDIGALRQRLTHWRKPPPPCGPHASTSPVLPGKGTT